MAEVPADGEGLSWIVDWDSTKLLLIPGLQPACIAAAAAGDSKALDRVRFAAQRHTAESGACTLNPLDKACLAASKAPKSVWLVFLPWGA